MSIGPLQKYMHQQCFSPNCAENVPKTRRKCARHAWQNFTVLYSKCALRALRLKPAKGADLSMIGRFANFLMAWPSKYKGQIGFPFPEDPEPLAANVVS